MKDSRDMDELKVYLSKFPKGVFAELAATRIKALEKVSSPQIVLTAPPTTLSQSRPLQTESIFKDCDDCPDMVAIPAGSFFMGSNEYANSQPIRLVSIPGFLLGKTEVTQGQWRAVTGILPFNFISKNHPVTEVTWADTQYFIQKLFEKTGKRYRLPSESEWE